MQEMADKKVRSAGGLLVRAVAELGPMPRSAGGSRREWGDLVAAGGGSRFIAVASLAAIEL